MLSLNDTARRTMPHALRVRRHYIGWARCNHALEARVQAYNSEMLRLVRFTGIPLLVLSYALTSFAQQRAVAFDDLPVAGTTDPAEARSINLFILDSLDRHRVSSIGFVIESRVQEVGKIQGEQLLDGRGSSLNIPISSHYNS